MEQTEAIKLKTGFKNRGYDNMAAIATGQSENLSGKCKGCTHKCYDGNISTLCLRCKRQYFPGMENEPYERKSDLYNPGILIP